MLGLRSRAPEWSPPPCICDEIEARVRVACAMRDEMARWPSPLEEWKALEAMPVLAPKGALPQVQARRTALDRLSAAEARVQAAEERVNRALSAIQSVQPLSNPAICPHPMKRFSPQGWRCTECGEIVKAAPGWSY